MKKISAIFISLALICLPACKQMGCKKSYQPQETVVVEEAAMAPEMPAGESAPE